MVLPDDIVIAARDGDLSTVQTWLESDAAHDVNDVAGADLPGDDVWSVKGRGLLHLAALCHGRQEDAGYDSAGLLRACEMVTYLVAHGANVNQRDAGGEPPLHLACGNALTEAVYVLLRAGADADGASTANAPLYWVFNGILQLADNERGDRDTGEVLQDMCTCMVQLLQAGAAIDFFHVAEGCGDPMRGLEDVILEVMYSPWACTHHGRTWKMRHSAPSPAPLMTSAESTTIPVASASSTRNGTASIMLWKSRNSCGRA